jgi:hypothetical protein
VIEMKNSYQSLLVKFFFVSLIIINAQAALADVTANPTASVSSSSTVIVHRPATDPSWGKVISYQQEQAVSNIDRTRETLHKFLFQDSNGIVRVVVYHEPVSGNGYWEIWVWDQP